MTQENLALEAGLERVFISWMENGHKQATFQTMLKLARALNCSAAELVSDAEGILNDSNSGDA
jgi:transcriptional regulator with XRE-family HTH domain